LKRKENLPTRYVEFPIFPDITNSFGVLTFEVALQHMQVERAMSMERKVPGL